jgi:hypothetical protein
MPGYDVIFPARGKVNPRHAYAMWSALCHVVPQLHHDDGVAVVTERERIIVRAPELLPDVINLGGRQLEVDGSIVRLGSPRVLPIGPQSVLTATIIGKRYNILDRIDGLCGALDAHIIRTETRFVTEVCKGGCKPGVRVTLERVPDEVSVELQVNGIEGCREGTRRGMGVWVAPS